MRSSLVLCLALLAPAAAGCAERRVPGPPPSDSTSHPLLPGPGGAESADVNGLLPDGSLLPGGPALADRSWIEAVRIERWPEAATLIDALPDSARARPELRYARARAAVGNGDGARAVTLLSGLDAELPLLTIDIARWRAEAQLTAGPFGEAAAYFSRSTRAHDLTRAAEAYAKAGEGGAARNTADRAVATAERAKSVRDEASARMVRARLILAQAGHDGGDPRTPGPAGDAAAEPDLRWVATRAPGTVDGRAASAELDRMKKPLTPKERAHAIEGITEPGPEAAPTIERMSKEGAPLPSSAPAPAPPRPPPPLRGEVAHARGMALFRAREYTEAARVLRDASASRSGHEAEDLHYAARSLGRIDRDEEAIKTYHDVTVRWPRSQFAERSAYYAARLELQDARYGEAAKAYTQYLSTYHRGEHREEAQYERALAQLSSGGAEAARKALDEMARRAPSDRAPRLRELLGVAALRAGDQAGAVAIWTEIVRNNPLTWAAMTARARLAAASAPVPPLIEPALSGGLRDHLDLRLPAAPALLFSVGLDGDAETHLAALEREAAAPYAGRESEALCGMYGLLSRAKRRYRVGINAVDNALLMRAPAEHERWAWECVYPQPFASGVRALEVEHAIPRGLVHALMRQESGFDPAIVSPASAVGLMQLMPATAHQASRELSMAFDPDALTRPDVNLRLGAFYVAKLLKMFQGSVVLAAAAYNAGPRAVSHWVEGGGDNDVDLWVARIPFDETRNYVARVMQNLARYQWLSGGDAAVMSVTLAMPSEARAPADAY